VVQAIDNVRLTKVLTALGIPASSWYRQPLPDEDQRRRPGPPPKVIDPHIVEVVVNMATENPWYGYQRIAVMCRRVRVQFKEIFDTAPDRATAEQQLAELHRRTESLGLDFSKFWTTYENWKTGILNYFDGRYTSAAVEGINNKARVITKRCYGVKSASSLWNRLILDLNRASEAAGGSIAELHEIVSGLKAVFLGFCT
jgi:hypothetical protein